MKKYLLKTIEFTPIIIIYIINFFRYKILYRWSIISSKAMLFNTKLWYQTRIWPETWCFNCDIWDFTYLNSGLGGLFSNQISSSLTNVKIWKFCSIGSNLQIPWGSHKINSITTFPINSILNKDNEWKDIIYKKTIIWNDVLIWLNVTILSGVIIWDWAIVWAWAVVTKDVLPYTIVGWIPAKIIKQRYAQETIDQLLRIQWRNRPLSKIKKNANLIWWEDIKSFFKTSEIK
jgi:acetyltransferase-like isoleucine patch superfamily enzyme